MSTCQIVIVYRGHTAVLTPGLVNIVVTIGVGGADWGANQGWITIIISAVCWNLHCHLHLCLSLHQTLIISSLKVFSSGEIEPNILGGNLFTLLKSSKSQIIQVFTGLAWVGAAIFKTNLLFTVVGGEIERIER